VGCRAGLRPCHSELINRIISRTNDGRVAAKARGVAFGRPKKMRPDQQQLARELVRDGKSISAVARTFNVHTATIYRVIEG
jgi:DNA invertase Pin-like site-specific DNA recombinase